MREQRGALEKTKHVAAHANLIKIERLTTISKHGLYFPCSVFFEIDFSDSTIDNITSEMMSQSTEFLPIAVVCASAVLDE